MCEQDRNEIGKINWTDLTVADADGVREFYAQVVGWTVKSHDMGEYEDYEMQSPDSGQPRAGICHARGLNADIPPQWLVYINVADLAASMARCTELGGRILAPERDLGSGKMGVIQDPAGAVAALWEPVGSP